MPENKLTVSYSVDPNTNPSTWPNPDQHISTPHEIKKVDVIYFNLYSGSIVLRTETNDNIDKIILQITKHIARGLYRLVTLNASEYSCVVVMTTDKSKDELIGKNGFPWDSENDPQPAVTLE
jgi:hypothetical protein